MTKTGPDSLEFAIKDAEHAFRLLEFAIRVMQYCELDQIDLDAFGGETTLKLEQENVTFNDGYFSTRENAQLTSQIAVGAAFGASAIALHNVFEATGRERDPSSTEELYTLWALVYAVRNAFAHAIAAPTWVVKAKYQRKIHLAFEGIDRVIDLSKLDGAEFEYGHLGGFGNWLRIKERVLDLVGT